MRRAALTFLLAACSAGSGPRDAATPDDLGAILGPTDASTPGDAGSTLLAMDASTPGDAGATSSAMDGSTPGDAGPSLWPVGATRVDAHEGGGMGVTSCLDGGRSAEPIRWSLSLPDGAFTRTRCGALVTDRVLTATELAAFDAAMRALTPAAQQTCGADKGVLFLTLTTPGGSLRYVDSFYACLNQPGAIYVDDIDPVFGSLPR